MLDEPTMEPDNNPQPIEPDSSREPVMAPLVAPDTGPAREWAEASRPLVTVHPDELPEGDSHLSVTRTFCFADLCGFTAYTRSHGPHEAVVMLGEFRRITRSVAAKRGVRVAKWLGDGAMLVSTDPAAAVSLGAHLIHHFAGRGIRVRVGAATGEALLFEGDDYVGEPVNLAAKLCAAAPPGEMYAVADEFDVPDWVRCIGDVTVQIRGVGPVSSVRRLLPRGLDDEREGQADALSDGIGQLTDRLTELSDELSIGLTELSDELSIELSEFSELGDGLTEFGEAGDERGAGGSEA